MMSERETTVRVRRVQGFVMGRLCPRTLAASREIELDVHALLGDVVALIGDELCKLVLLLDGELAEDFSDVDELDAWSLDYLDDVGLLLEEGHDLFFLLLEEVFGGDDEQSGEGNLVGVGHE